MIIIVAFYPNGCSQFENPEAPNFERIASASSSFSTLSLPSSLPLLTSFIEVLPLSQEINRFRFHVPSLKQNLLAALSLKIGKNYLSMLGVDFCFSLFSLYFKISFYSHFFRLLIIPVYIWRKNVCLREYPLLIWSGTPAYRISHSNKPARYTITLFPQFAPSVDRPLAFL